MINELRKTIRQIIRETYMDEGGFSRVVSTIRGGIDSVDRIVIISAENPMNKKHPAEYNNKAMSRLYSDLESSGYGYVKMKGLYDRLETSLMINGMSKGEGFRLAKKYKQESYIFGYRKELDENKSVMVFELIHPWDSGSNMTSRMTIANSDVQDFKNYYSLVKGRKFQIPFYDEMLAAKQLPTGAAEPEDIEPSDEEQKLTYRQIQSMKGKAKKMAMPSA
jgi:hypothetical protein